jgi:hypothetical protein
VDGGIAERGGVFEDEQGLRGQRRARRVSCRFRWAQ